jgi:formylglycine-generating enzyme required for sulfatase activity
MEFVFVEGGCFQMGDTFGDGYKDETPAHVVCVDGFWMGKYEVTQGQWEKVFHYNPSFYPRGDNYPVEQVTWNDTQEFSQKLSQSNRKQFRLPTEAEWEYAARSGGKREKWAGTSDESQLTEYAWDSDNAGNSPQPVGQKKSNGLGLYDMSGNVWEWCQDSYDGNYYSDSPRNDPKGPLRGRDKVARGGSWIVGPWYCRTTYREWVDPSDRYYYFGFRLVLASH